MHVISNDRALGQWRALLGLPCEIALGLTGRLFREQPGLLTLLVDFSGAACAKPGGPPVHVEASDLRMTLFEWVADHATLLADSTKWLDNPPPKDDPLLSPLEDDLDVIADAGQPYITPPKVGRNDPCPCAAARNTGNVAATESP